VSNIEPGAASDARVPSARYGYLIGDSRKRYSLAA